MINKKGGEKLLTIWWFFVIVIIGVGIVAGVLLFYGADVDSRTLEANILAEKVGNCLNNQGFLIDNYMNSEFDIFSECSIEKRLFESNSDFYLKVEIFNKNAERVGEKIVVGNILFEKDCSIGKSVQSAKNYPKCFSTEENLLYYNNGSIEVLNVKILAGSNQNIRKGDFI